MKFDAHPLVVAAAMGLLNPAALAAVGEEGEGFELHDAHVGEPPTEGWTPAAEPPDAAELHRVEIEWLKVQRS